MSGVKHTPGPWGYERSEAQNAWEVAPKDAEGRLDWAREVCITADENEANVRLIAAAPRLAAELAAWRAWAERWGRDIETSVSVSPITHNELVERLAATNAALREAGVEP